MRIIKHFFTVLFKIIWALVSTAIAVALIFLVSLYFTSPKMASDLAKSCVSCKKPGLVIIGPHDVDGDGRLTAKDWGIFITPSTTEPKVRPDLNPTEQQAIALERVNYYRRLVGVKPVALNKHINKAAESHARYSSQHAIAGHVQIEGETSFSGVWPWDRIKYFGYKNYTYVTEVCSARWASPNYALRTDPVWAIDGWMSTVYHRLPLINPNVYEAGFGAVEVNNNINYVMDFANPGFPDKKRIICYPVDNQKNVPLEFTGDETPDPLPGKTYPVGYPISVTFNGYKDIDIKEIGLRDCNGVDIDFYRLLPYSDKYMKESLVIVPKEPLERGMTYRVRVIAYADHKLIHRDWSFKTRR